MLLSLSWLREFTPYEGTAQALGDRLTMLGLELEELRHPFAALEAITTGHVVNCSLHPDSDHLHCCQVDVGGEALLDIVCGAPNVAAGQKVAVATIGSRLPDGTVIKKSKLRGQPSHGMICSERELGLSDDHSGIMVLPENTPVGRRLVDELDLDRDVLDLSITPNRADCLSVLGLARETAMAFHLPLTIPERSLDCVEDSAALPIAIQDPELCWLYAGRVISGVTVAPSPAKIRYRLMAVGVRAISNLVDVTNYILMECGQPLHAFDLEKLAGRKIVVRPATEGENFVTLDGQNRLLKSRDLCICDGEKAVALAGVMGGLESEITETTTSVFLESAVFQPASIRKTSRRLGLSSEASFRFERGIDQERSVWALDRACAMMAQLAHGKVHKTLSVNQAKAFVPATIAFSPKQADTLLGLSLGSDFALEVLQGVGCQVQTGTEPWQVTQPSWRPDLTRAADLVEEVGRVYGLDNIPPALPAMEFSLERAGEAPSDFVFWQKIRHWAAGLGLNEAINYSFVGHKDLDLLQLPQEDRISIMNPLTAEQNVLRTVLAPGLLQALRNNLAQGAQSVRLFELAHVFHASQQSETGARETGILGFVLHGLRNEDVWPYTPETMDYSDLRGFLEHLLATLHLPPARFVACAKHPYLLPAIDIFLGDEPLGCLGRLVPAIANEYLAHEGVWLAEVNLDLLKKASEKAAVHFVGLASFPPVRRDITVIGGRELSVGSIVEHIRSMKLPYLEDLAFVCEYEPEGSEERHLSFRLTFRHPSRTLKDGEVDKERNKVAQSLINALPVRI